jgi:hypothetical protein
MTNRRIAGANSQVPLEGVRSGELNRPLEGVRSGELNRQIGLSQACLLELGWSKVEAARHSSLSHSEWLGGT